ncbi:MAG TPA: DUF1801 domain-containing protein, partial [Blastocatellia bacterium]
IRMLSDYDIKVGELALGLRDIVLGQAPEAIESLFRSYAVSLNYSFTAKWNDGFCMIVVYPRHVNLGFHRGAELDDPKGLLEGDGKIMRHIKIASPDDLKKPHLKTFIRAAMKNAKRLEAEKAMTARGRQKRTSPKKTPR